MNESYYGALPDSPYLLPLETLIPAEISFPFYFIDKPSLLPFLSDKVLSLLAPVVAYWLFSLFFHLMDTSGYFDQHKIHEPAEITKRNKVTPSQVIKAVIAQHLVQTAMGLAVLEEEPSYGIDHQQAMLKHAAWVLFGFQHFLGNRLAFKILSVYGPQLTYAAYWWIVPFGQVLWASFVIDTWQYFLHRGMHMNKFLYRHIHSLHHRLYCPYSYGALYNHPIEGFLMDTVSGLLAHLCAGLNTRQDTLVFTIATMKTVDDHCGMALPFDPFQRLFGNNADYHDIHHQQFGIKKNFSQPYFIHWDVLLGTRMLRSEAPKRKHTDDRDPLTSSKLASKEL